jgi:hypothetical protein
MMPRHYQSQSASSAAVIDVSGTNIVKRVLDASSHAGLAASGAGARVTG